MLFRETVESTTWELLIRLMSYPELQGFALAGGTSLALQIGHRRSFDLDFFGPRPFSVQEILDVLQDLTPITILSQSENILILNLQGVKVDFVNYRYPLLTPIVSEEDIRLVSVPDIAAMKLAAIAGRGKKRDFYDLYFLLKQYSLDQLLQFYKSKYEDGSELMVLRSLPYFDDADQDEEVVLIRPSIKWEDVKKSIAVEVKKFSGN